jgi:hypothetical protein
MFVENVIYILSKSNVLIFLTNLIILLFTV